MFHINDKEEIVGYEFNGEKMTVDYEDGTKISGNWDGEKMVLEGEYFVEIFTENESEEDTITQYDYAYAVADIVVENYESISNWLCAVVGIVLYIIGIVTMIYPNETYFFMRGWLFNNTELSEVGESLQRIGGGLVAIMGLWVISGLFVFFMR